MLSANKVYEYHKKNNLTDKSFKDWLTEKMYEFERDERLCPHSYKEEFLKYLNNTITNQKNYSYMAEGEKTFNLKEFYQKNKKVVNALLISTGVILVGYLGYKLYQKYKSKNYYYYDGDSGYDYDYQYLYENDDDNKYFV